MKRPVIAFTIVILTVALGIFSLFFVKSNSEKMLNEIIAAEENLKENNFYIAKLKVIKSQEIFNKKEKLFNIFIGQNLSEEIKEYLRKAELYLDLNHKDFSYFYIEESIDALNRAYDFNELSFETIF